MSADKRKGRAVEIGGHTEVSWFACTDPGWTTVLLGEVGTSDRKRYLFGCACCRRVWNDFASREEQAAVEAAEAFADGLISAAARKRARKLVAPPPRNFPLKSKADFLRGAARKVSGDNSYYAFHAHHDILLAASRRGMPPEGYEESDDWRAGSWRTFIGPGKAELCRLLRDLIGNPFHPARIDPAVRSPTVVSLAQATYDERQMPSGAFDPVRLAILSDALEDAGCADESFLAHLRSPGPHVRGCWLIDLILGKN